MQVEEQRVCTWKALCQCQLSRPFHGCQRQGVGRWVIMGFCIGQTSLNPESPLAISMTSQKAPRLRILISVLGWQ